MSDDPAAAELERIFGDLIAHLTRLRTLAGERLDAIRRADASRLASTIAKENETVQQVVEVEKRRVAAVTTLAQRLGSAEKSQTRLTWIAQRLGGSIGERLSRRADELRDAVQSLAPINEAARQAAQHLAQHMEGLWRQAAAVLNHSKTYGRVGRIEPGPAVVSALDVRS